MWTLVKWGAGHYPDRARLVREVLFQLSGLHKGFLDTPPQALATLVNAGEGAASPGGDPPCVFRRMFSDGQVFALWG